MARASRRPQMPSRISKSGESFLSYRLQKLVCNERFIVRAFYRFAGRTLQAVNAQYRADHIMCG